MLFCRSRVLMVCPLSLGNFIKHLPISSLNFSTNGFNLNKHKKCFATASLRSSQFDNLTDHQKSQVKVYVDSLLQWNQKMNLTAVREESEVMERHVEDSLAIIEPIRSSYISHCGDSWENINVVDVGSGAGLPGLILAIACPGWKVTLLESMNKRCVYLEHAISATGLSNVQVVRGRAEVLSG